MALKIRLTRGGAKKHPIYRIVVAEATSPRDGRFIEKLGTYNPMLKKDDPARLTLNEERIKHWLSVGALPTDRIARFLGNKDILPKRAVPTNPLKSQPKKKAQERAAAAAGGGEAAAGGAAPASA